MTSFVYFARNTVTNEVKIGTSILPKDRARALAKACGAPVEIIAIGRGNRYAEGFLHAQVWDLHIGHEWFRADRRIDRLAKSVAAGTFRFPASFWGHVSPLRREAAFKAHATRRARLAMAA